MSRSVDLSLDEPTPRELSLSGTIPGDGAHSIFLALSVTFVQRLKNQQRNDLHDRSHNAMAIIRVDTATDESCEQRKESQVHSRPRPKREPVKRRHNGRSPLARPFIPAMADEPFALQSIVAQVLKLPDTLGHLVNDRNTIGELSRIEQAALGLFKLFQSGAVAETSRAHTDGAFARDGP